MASSGQISIKLLKGEDLNKSSGVAVKLGDEAREVKTLVGGSGADAIFENAPQSIIFEDQKSFCFSLLDESGSSVVISRNLKIIDFEGWEWKKGSAMVGDGTIHFSARFSKFIVGKLKVKVIEARDLLSADRNGFSDPYAVVSVGPQSTMKYRTQTQKKTLNPKFDEDFPFRVNRDWNLDIEVWDWDKMKSDDFLGSLTIDHWVWACAVDKEDWYNVVLPNGTVQGAIKIKTSFERIDDDDD